MHVSKISVGTSSFIAHIFRWYLSQVTIRAPKAAVNRNVQGCATSLVWPVPAAVHADGWASRYRLHQIFFVPPPRRRLRPPAGATSDATDT